MTRQIELGPHGDGVQVFTGSCTTGSVIEKEKEKEREVETESRVKAQYEILLGGTKHRTKGSPI